MTAPARSEIFLRPLGSPLPLGLSGLAVASLLVSGLDLGWVPASAGHQVGMLLLVGAVPLQLLACAFALPARAAAAQAGGKPLLGLTLGIASARLVLSALHELTGSGGLQTVSGIVGLVVVACAGYMVVALELEDAQDQAVLPVGRRGRAARDTA